MKKALHISAVLLVCLLPITAFAQTTPAPGTPTWPWWHSWNPYNPDYPSPAKYGQVVRYIEVPPQQVVVPVYIPGPGSFPGEFEQQVVEIPGYVVTETTTGYIHPQRWSLEQVSPGVYYWRVLPPLFTRK